MKHLALCLSGILLTLAPLAAEELAKTTKFDIVYKTTEQGPLKLDLHYPSAPVGGSKFPLVLFTHGGGWAAGNKTIGDRGVRFLGVKALNERGFCVAAVDYRLCTKDGDITIRDCVTDAKDAMRFLAKNAETFSLDADQVFTWGDSAGGHLAQMLLLTPPDSFPDDPDLAGANYHLVAGVSWYGPCDFEKTELFNGPGQTDVRDRFGARIVKPGTEEAKKLAAYREVSPVNYLKADSPPLLMMQGDMDTTIPIHHARYLKERADAIHAPVEVFIVKNSGHNWREAGGPLSPSLDEVVRTTVKFLADHLKSGSR